MVDRGREGRRGPGPRWTGRAGAVGRGPRWTAHRSGRVRGLEAAGRRDERRWRHWRRAGARRCGDAGHEKARQGHGRARLDATSAMAGLPPRNDEGKEKLDGGGADSASSARVWVLGTALGF